MKPIMVGDLVWVRKTHCPGDAEGRIATVTALRFPMVGPCERCGKEFTAVAAELNGLMWNPVQWLKRIPPLPELDDVQRDEEIEA